VTIEPLVDAVGVLGSLEEFYPGTPLEAWAPYRESYPELFVGDSWRLPILCHLITSGDHTVLVDTGAGPPGGWKDWEPEQEGGLLAGLAAHGVEPAEVDVVLMTHVHIDHVGWNTDAAGEPVFPRARYLLEEHALAAARERADRPHIQRCLLKIEDRLESFAGETEIVPGVTAVPLPGHDPGHVGVRVGGVLMIGDAAPHPALLDHPDWEFAYDLDSERAVATRAGLVDRLDGEVVLSSHFSDWRR